MRRVYAIEKRIDGRLGTVVGITREGGMPIVDMDGVEYWAKGLCLDWSSLTEDAAR